jgi:rhodanese-related sulfurtransferase
MYKTVTALLFLGTLTSGAFGYDLQKAKDFEKFYAGMTQKACADSKLFIGALETMQLIKEDKEYLILDVRSAGEYGVMGVNLKKSLHIPIEHLFKKENLDKLPTNIPVIVTCHSGTRGLMAAMALKQSGFTNIQVLKGGLIALADANTPANAPMQ